MPTPEDTGETPAPGGRREDCSPLESQLSDLNKRIRVRRLESEITTLETKRAAAKEFSDKDIWAERAAEIGGASKVGHKILSDPLHTPQHEKDYLRDVSASERTIADIKDRVSRSLERYDQQLGKLRTELSQAVADAGDLAGKDYSEENLADLQKRRDEVTRDLKRCRAAAGHFRGFVPP